MTENEKSKHLGIRVTIFAHTLSSIGDWHKPEDCSIRIESGLSSEGAKRIYDIDFEKVNKDISESFVNFLKSSNVGQTSDLDTGAAIILLQIILNYFADIGWEYLQTLDYSLTCKDNAYDCIWTILFRKE